MRISDALKKAVSPEAVVLVATSDGSGTPHLAAARGLAIADDEHVAFADWFCFQTLRNLEKNPKVALALLEPDGTAGIQILGEVTAWETAEILDGYGPDDAGREVAFPQARQSLRIRVDELLSLSPGPHSDRP